MKDGLTEINSKFYQKCNVVMLPTKKASKILRTPTGLQSSDIPMIKRKHLSPQHIYILSSEEIKEGESSWIINKNRDTIYFIKNAQKDEDELKGINKNWNKIIATTDILLTDYIKVEGGFGSCYNKLPRPSDDFIKAFVKAQGKGFDKVLVEYKDYWVQVAHSMDVDYKLKVSPDNTITIRAIQEEKIDIIDLAEIELKSYVNPSEEFKDAFIAGVTIGYYHKNKEAIHTWIDKGIDVFSGEKTSWSREEVIRFAEKYARMVQEKPIQLNAYKTIHNNKWIEENL